MRFNHLLIYLIIVFFLSDVNYAVSWFAAVDGWEIYRESGTVGLNVEGYVSGEISSINVTPHGERMEGYHSRYADVDLNDVRLRDRTEAYEGHIESKELLCLRSSAKETVIREKSKPRGEVRIAFNFYEIWPVIISSSREVGYTGTGINDREFAGNNLDYVGSSFLYNTELSKTNIRDLSLNRMNATVIASDDGVKRVIFEPTMNLSCWISAQATGISSLKYRKTASDQETVLGEGEERFYGINKQKTVIKMSSFHGGRKKKRMMANKCRNSSTCSR